MATCPACNHDVATPFFLNMDAWRHLACPHCRVRLEMKPRPVAVCVLPILSSMSLLARKGHAYAVIAEVLLVSSAVTLVLLLTVRPKLRLRQKPLPQPTIRLNIDGPSN